MVKPLWEPSRERIEQANITRFIEKARSEFEPCITDYNTLYNWSIIKPEEFWKCVWEFCDIRASSPWNTVVTDINKMPGAKWFVGSKLNFAQNLLRYRDEKPSIIFWSENGKRSSLSYAKLYDQVARLARSLRDAGVNAGDRVAGFMPNIPETVIAMLATTSTGAIWSSSSQDFGINGVLDRFGQIKPKILFTTDGYFYNGKTINSLSRIKEIIKKLPCVEKVVVVPCINNNPSISEIDKGIFYSSFLSQEKGLEIEFAQLPFDHPLYIMYSSGTTGIPKCIVHGAGGTLIQHLKELTLHTDVKRSDRIFYHTTCGWMLWNWLVSSLAVGATILLYEGSPLRPKKDILFDYAEEEKMTLFGTSAKFLSVLEKAGLEPGKTHDLSSLKGILSTGSPLSPESFDFVYRNIKKDICLSSISGGTDIISCFALGNPVGPVYRGELQCRGLGMKVEIFNENGQSVRGEKGELVCTAPFPSMPIYFWNDPDGIKYRQAYFENYPNVWCHGDYSELTEHDGLIIYGRSDAILNPAGVRIGTAEIYREVEKIPDIVESIVVGQDWDNDIRIILFVKLREGVALDQEFVKKIKVAIKENTSPHHVPAKVVQIDDIPRTINGKIAELTVGNVIHNRPVKNIDALANPESLALYKNIQELQN